MLMKMRSKMQNEKGFTLVELMVVVVILGILIAIAVPVYSNVTKNAQERAHEANVRTIQGAAQMYIAAQATPPNTIDLNEETVGDTSAKINEYLNEPGKLVDPRDGSTKYKVKITKGVVEITPGLGTSSTPPEEPNP